MEINWIKDEGVKFLQKVGLKENYYVLDFGCNGGNYTLPAALITKKGSGRVVAVDIDKNVFDNIKHNSIILGLNNIIYYANHKNNYQLDFENNYFDIILAYDILHYFNKNFRFHLYKEFYRLLKSNGILSIFPKHTKNDFPWDYFSDLTKEDVKNEVEMNGFLFHYKICDQLLHFGMKEFNCVYNFKKI